MIDAQTRARYSVLPHTHAAWTSGGKWVPFEWLSYLSKIIAPHLYAGTGRFLISAPPQHGKSEFFSHRLPSWYLERFKDRKVILASYAHNYAEKWGAKVRDTLLNNGVSLSQDTKSKSRFVTSAGGQMITAGIGGPITGEGANLFIIDDPIKNYEEAMSERIRERNVDWFRSVAATRMQPGGGTIICMHCMTGDTPVLMADGTEKPLRDIHPGDSIATYEDGQISTSTVMNWKCNGPDRIFLIKMTSGITVRANERHPFLVCNDGGMKWIKLKNLRVGDKLMRAAIGASGEECRALSRGAECQPEARVIACLTTAKPEELSEYDRHQPMRNHIGPHTCDIGMASKWKTITGYLKIRLGIAPFVRNHRPVESICLPVGSSDCVSTTVTAQERREDCSATSATLSLSMAIQSKSCLRPLSTYEPTLDCIADITACGTEDVFDIQVDRTENFIANGLVSHNTRWHEADLIGELSQEAGWLNINLPAIAEEGDLLGRAIGTPLCAERYSAEDLLRIRREVKEIPWTAMYQGNPILQGGNIVKGDWIKRYDELPKMDEFAIFADLTYKQGEELDYTVIECWGRRGPDIYLISQIRDQMGFQDQVTSLGRMFELYPDAFHKEIEEKANGSAVIEMLKEHFPGLEANNPKTEKAARLAVVAPLYHAGNVWYPSEQIAPWVTTNIAEITKFPKAKHDDTVDVASMAVGYFGRMASSLRALEALSRR